MSGVDTEIERVRGWPAGDRDEGGRLLFFFVVVDFFSFKVLPVGPVAAVDKCDAP